MSPFSLMLGRDPLLPVDLVFGLDSNQTQKVPLTKYMDSLKARLKHSFELVSAAADKARAKQKKGYDLRVRGADVEVDERVLVKVVAFDGKHKLADKWEESGVQSAGQTQLIHPSLCSAEGGQDWEEKNIG